MGQKYKFESDQHIKSFKIQSMKLNETHKENNIGREEKTSFQYLERGINKRD